MRCGAFLFLLMLIRLSVFPQSDSVIYNKDLPLSDRIYLTYADFRKGLALSKSQIVSKQDPDQLEFLTKVLSDEKLTFKVSEEPVTIDSRTVWGYLQNNTFYVNYKGDFYRIPVFGSISYLVANVTVVNPGFYDPRFGYSTGSSTSKEIREFLMNFYEGKVSEFSMGYAQELLSRDKELFAEFSKLSKRKQKEEIYKYIRKFNERHPVYFLKP